MRSGNAEICFVQKETSIEDIAMEVAIWRLWCAQDTRHYSMDHAQEIDLQNTEPGLKFYNSLLSIKAHGINVEARLPG